MLRVELNSADPSRSVPRAANPPCHHQKCARPRPRLRPLDLMGPGNGILRAETGGRLQAQNAGERPEFGSQTALRPLTDRNCEGFCRPGNHAVCRDCMVERRGLKLMVIVT